MTRTRLSDLLSRALVGMLFVFLSINLLGDFLRTHHVTGLLLLLSESLVVALTIVRRRARLVDRSIAAIVVTTISMAGPPLLRTAEGEALMPDHFTAIVLAVGLALVVAGKLALGRSFGLVPANRGVVAQGPYKFVRHPIYLGYLVTHIGFLAAHPRPLNILIVVCSDSALIVRALFEERVLEHDERYREYCGRVGWHLVPGVF